jgi:hypothetical protein
MTLVSQAIIIIFIVEAHGRNISTIAIYFVLAGSGLGGSLGAITGSRLRILGNNSKIKIQPFVWGRPKLPILFRAFIADLLYGERVDDIRIRRRYGKRRVRRVSRR